MRFDKRHFARLEDLRGEVLEAQEELDYAPENRRTHEIALLKQELKDYKKALSDYLKQRPGLIRAYNAFIRAGKSTLD